MDILQVYDCDKRFVPPKINLLQCFGNIFWIWNFAVLILSMAGISYFIPFWFWGSWELEKLKSEMRGNLIDYWMNPKSIAVATTNKANRNMSKTNHSCGSKSLPIRAIEKHRLGLCRTAICMSLARKRATN